MSGPPVVLAAVAQPDNIKFTMAGTLLLMAAGGISVKLVCKPGEGVLARMGRRDCRVETAIARCTVFEPTAAALAQ